MPPIVGGTLVRQVGPRAGSVRAGRLVGLALGVAALVAGCATGPVEPTYTQEELRLQCERAGGWWRGDLIANYCARRD